MAPAIESAISSSSAKAAPASQAQLRVGSDGVEARPARGSMDLAQATFMLARESLHVDLPKRRGPREAGPSLIQAVARWVSHPPGNCAAAPNATDGAAC